MTALPKPALEYASVRTWAKALREQWGGDPLAEEPERIEALEAFCDFTGRDPDELVAFCFLRKKDTGQRFGSVKRREEMVRRLRAFREAEGRPTAEARRRQSDILSFLIHNGVLIQARVP